MRKLRRTLVLVACLGAVLAAPAVASAAGTIEGRVTNAETGEPIPFVPVCAYESVVQVLVECTETEFGGEYEMSVLPGAYKVAFEPSAFRFFTQWFLAKPSFATADPVAVAEGEVVPNVNAALQEIVTTGSISGTVTDAGNGSGISGIEVCASRIFSGSEFSFGEYCERTNAGGQYELTHVEPGSYRVQFSSAFKFNEGSEGVELESGNYVSQFYSGQARAGSATPVGVTVGLDTPNINAALQPGATISGTVTDAVSNAALQGISVCAWGATEFQCSETDKSGNYSIPTLSAGGYKVEFAPQYFFNPALVKEGKLAYTRGELPLADYARQYWNDKVSFEAAEAVNAVAGATVTGINAKMAKEVQPPPPPPTPGTAVVGPKAKVKGGKAALSVKCEGAGACSGTLKLTAKVVTVTKAKKGKAKKKVHLAVIGQGKFSVPAGKTKTVPVKLNGAGKLLVEQAGAKGVKAKVSGTGVKSGSVKLVGKSAPKKHPKKHKRNPKKQKKNH